MSHILEKQPLTFERAVIEWEAGTKPAPERSEAGEEQTDIQSRFLYQISNNLIDFQSPELSLPDVLKIADQALGLRVVMLLEKKRSTQRMTIWHAKHLAADEIRKSQLELLSDPSLSLPLEKRKEIEESTTITSLFPEDKPGPSEPVPPITICPLLSPDGSLIGVLGLQGHIAFGKSEMAFVRIFTKQLSRSLGRYHAWLDEFILREAGREELERVIHELERSNLELEQFGFVTSHDLQEPLRMITSYLQLLELRYRDQFCPEAIHYMHFVTEGASRMRTLIDDLLRYATVSSQKTKSGPIDLNDALGIALKNLEFRIRENEALITHKPLPTLVANKAQMAELFQNLIGNAIKFRRNERPVIRVQSERTENAWLFSVRDNGLGIHPNYARKIFDMFQRLHSRTDYPGTGIGLSICKKIVESYGGRIWVESEPEQGSTFYFTFPH